MDRHPQRLSQLEIEDIVTYPAVAFVDLEAERADSTCVTELYLPQVDSSVEMISSPSTPKIDLTENVFLRSFKSSSVAGLENDTV